MTVAKFADIRIKGKPKQQIPGQQGIASNKIPQFGYTATSISQLPFFIETMKAVLCKPCESPYCVTDMTASLTPGPAFGNKNDVLPHQTPFRQIIFLFTKRSSMDIACFKVHNCLGTHFMFKCHPEVMISAS